MGGQSTTKTWQRKHTDILRESQKLCQIWPSSTNIFFQMYFLTIVPKVNYDLTSSFKEPIWSFNYYWKPRHQLFQKPPSEKCKCNYDMMYYLQPNLQLPLMICAGRSLVLKVYTKFHVGLSDFRPIIIKSYFVSYAQ